MDKLIADLTKEVLADPHNVIALMRLANSLQRVEKKTDLGFEICVRCGSDRIISCGYSYDAEKYARTEFKNINQNGYADEIGTYCANCGQLQAAFPLEKDWVEFQYELQQELKKYIFQGIEKLGDKARLLSMERALNKVGAFLLKGETLKQLYADKKIKSISDEKNMNCHGDDRLGHIETAIYQAISDIEKDIEKEEGLSSKEVREFCFNGYYANNDLLTFEEIIAKFPKVLPRVVVNRVLNLQCENAYRFSHHIKKDGWEDLQRKLIDYREQSTDQSTWYDAFLRLRGRNESKS